MNTTYTPLGEMMENEGLFDALCRIQKKEKHHFSKGMFEDLHSPFAFKDMQKAVDIIKNTIQEKKRIMVFGDYDVDGISGTAQLYLALKTVGAIVSYRLPCRDDGYGLSQKFIDEAHQNNVSVFITTDCGVSNYKEIEHANTLGIKVIITDHHSVPEHIPLASAILHPLVPSEPFPDKHLTGSGVAWYLCYALFQTFFPDHASHLAHELLELAVLGTVADCGNLEGQNRIITQLGLETLQNTKNTGLKKLIEISGTKETINPESIGFYLAPRINASGRLAHPRIALELLLGNEERAKDLDDLNKQRQEILEILLAEAMEQAEKQKNEVAILVKASHWPSGIIGLISGRLAETFGRPVIAFEESDHKITGSCRGPEGFHIANTLKKIKAEHPEIFIGCGGHAQAAGLSIYPEHYERFEEYYKNEVKKIRGTTPPPVEKKYLFRIPRALQKEEIEELWTLGEPFGIGNPLPIFCWENMKILTIKTVGAENKHLSLFLATGFEDDPMSGIWFRAGEKINELQKGEKVKVYATPEIRTWNGKINIGLKIVEIEK